MTTVDVPGDYKAVVVGHDQVLVLIPRSRVTAYEVKRMADQLPDLVRGRVVIAHDCDAYVVASSAERET